MLRFASHQTVSPLVTLNRLAGRASYGVTLESLEVEPYRRVP
jgi:hypothetical protein